MPNCRARIEAEYEQATDKTFTCEKLTYSSDGLPVIAFLYRTTAANDRSYPLVIFNRGSYVVNNQLPCL